MAKDSKPKRQLKPAQTVRERAQSSSEPKKVRRIKQVTTGASTKIKSVSAQSKREYHIINLPDNRIGRFLTKSRRIIPKFFHEAFTELKLVEWPNRKDTTKFTTAVIIFAFTFGTIIALTDFVLGKVFKNLLNLN